MLVSLLSELMQSTKLLEFHPSISTHGLKRHDRRVETMISLLANVLKLSSCNLTELALVTARSPGAFLEHSLAVRIV
jgi:hypothetical protein